MRARVTVKLKPSVLDPPGEAIERALLGLGFASVRGVRVGKVVEVDLGDTDKGHAEKALSEMADRLLANPVIEDYSVEIVG